MAGSVVSKISRVAVFSVKGDVHSIIFDADSFNSEQQFGTIVLPDAVKELARGDNSVKVLIVLEDGFELGITRSGEEVKIETWPRLGHSSEG